MNSNKYVLDRFEDEQGVFLLDGLENQKKLISLADIPSSISEGDVVELDGSEGNYTFNRLVEGTGNTDKKVSEMIEGLRSKNDE